MKNNILLHNKLPFKSDSCNGKFNRKNSYYGSPLKLPFVRSASREHLHKEICKKPQSYETATTSVNVSFLLHIVLYFCYDEPLCTVSSRNFKIEDHLKQLIFHRKFSGPRTFTSRYQKFEISGDEM